MEKLKKGKLFDILKRKVDIFCNFMFLEILLNPTFTQVMETLAKETPMILKLRIERLGINMNEHL